MGSSRSSPDYLRYFGRPADASGVRHLLHLLLLAVLNVVISTAALFYSLGYQVNWSARTIQQTGTISLDSTFSGFEGHVLINGVEKTAKLPYHFSRAFPGEYTVEVREDGFQTWEKLVRVEENRVNSFNDIVLVAQSPQNQVSTSASDRSAVENGSPNQRNIDVRANELWVNGEFITRSSQNIKSAQWYPDKSHVAYQIGKTLWLLDMDSLTTQRLAQLNSSAAVSFVFRRSGRQMLYEDGGKVHVVDLLTPQ